MDNRRVAPRFDLRVPVVFRRGAASGEGMIWNISTSGARIEHVSAQEAAGTSLRLRASFHLGSFEVELAAEVVRQTEGGFAVRFIDLGEPELSMLLAALPEAAATYMKLGESDPGDE